MLEYPARQHIRGDDGQHLVAVDDVTLLVHQDHPIGVAVERDTHMGALGTHRFLQPLWMRRANVTVDVRAIGRDTERNHVGTQPPKQLRSDAVGSTVRAVDGNTHALEGHPRWCERLQEFNVALVRHRRCRAQCRAAAADVGGAEMSPFSTDRSMPCSASSGNLKPVPSKNLRPLSWKGLCDADTTAPAFACSVRVK